MNVSAPESESDLLQSHKHFADPENVRPLRATQFGLEHLEAHGRTLGGLLGATATRAGHPLLKQFRRNVESLRASYRVINDAFRKQEPLGAEADWLLDNFHIISDSLTEIKTDLPTGYYHLLPKLADGPWKNFPRVYVLALEMIAHCDSCLDEQHLTRFIQAYQASHPLTVGELWAVPIMLRLCLVDNLRRLAENILRFRLHREQAGNLIAAQCEPDSSGPAPETFGLNKVHEDWRDCYAFHLIEGLRDHEATHPDALINFERFLERSQQNSVDIQSREKQRHAANQVSIGNCVISLRLLASLDWAKFFEQTSHLEKVLCEDPAGMYAKQDFATRDRYRQLVEQMARRTGIEELEVAQRLLQLARSTPAAAPAKHQRHIGYFLVDDGRPDFERVIGYTAPWNERISRGVRRHPRLFYFGALACFTLGLLALVAWGAGNLGWLAVLLAALAFLPASELALSWINALVPIFLAPRTLPRLDFKAGIPLEHATFVVIPTLLTSPQGAEGLVERLEIHYLSNPDEQLFFGLLTDFTDAPAETAPDDELALNAAIEGIRRLNAKYFPGESERFFLFHRPRQWNEAQGCWMAWERKRGKLEEFNRLLRKRDGLSIRCMSPGLEMLPEIRYVITLDTDTQLPRETAKRLIATLAHPLNRPQFDVQEDRVVRGFGILQPRVSLSLRGAGKSLFARIFGRSTGLDPYTTAVSDTYMDLFGSGSFTGKGIYEIDAFEAATGNRFPDNQILSHDLIEGNFVRCGLVTDVEVIDDFPSHYLAYVRREHRWVRGDWQIMPWLRSEIPDAAGKMQKNPLGPVARWKILDNMRRSLTPPALLAFLLVGWLTHAAGWTTSLVLLVIGWPLVAQLLGTPARLVRQWGQGKSTMPETRELWPTAVQGVLALMFLVVQALSVLDAIVRTLHRMFVSRRHLLEWETAAATEGKLGTAPKFFARGLWQSPIAALVVTGLLAWANPEGLWFAAPILFGWLLAPIVAWIISQPRRAPLTSQFDADEAHALRRLSRQTWGFFETFVSAQDNWLPPDNFQEDPKGEIAHRTSPTNIGLYLLSCVAAHDLGYLTTDALLRRIQQTLATLASMEKAHGHLYNWYDTETLSPLLPKYLSTVDSGNLAACLVALKQSLLEKLQNPISRAVLLQGLRDTLDLAAEPPQPALAERFTRLRNLLEGEPEASQWLQRLADIAAATAPLREAPTADATQKRWMLALDDQAQFRLEEETALADRVPAHNGSARFTLLAARLQKIVAQIETMGRSVDFRVLYNEERDLFAVGYNVSQGRLDNSHYDLLASEAALTSFLAVARGDVPKKHWFQLGRPLARAGGGLVLLSWGGTMFEFLMPRLLLPVVSETLLEESQRCAVLAQIEYGAECGVPWGISESAYNAFDVHKNYQYQAFGAPSIGLKRGLAKDLVVAPYATGLALMTHPRQALANFKTLRTHGGEGAHGFYEAIDFTAERLPKGKTSTIIKCYMAHHQGMILLAANNCLFGNLMQKRFRAEPMVRATELLLQERVPRDIALTEPQPQAVLPSFRETSAHLSRRITTPHTAHPRTHLLASARYSLMITNSGSGQSSARGMAVTRWRQDRTCETWGQFLYVRDLRSGLRWSAGYQPVRKEADEYEVTYANDKVEFRRMDGGIETRMEITVSPENHAEVRRVTFVNHNHRSRHLEVTSYAEIVLAPQNADLAHPAFSKLFLETEYVAAEEALICRRRPRAAEAKPVFAVHVLAADGRRYGDAQYETDRAKFLGRGRTPANPAALDQDPARLSGTTGPVLDPIFSLRRHFRIKPGATMSFAFTTAVTDTREEALALADQYHDFQGVNRAFELAWAHAQIELRHTHVTAAETHLYQRLAAHVIFSGPALRAKSSLVVGNRLSQNALWRFGISGDIPIALVRIGSADELPLVRQAIAAHAFWRLKGLACDLVILNEEDGGYFEELQKLLAGLVRSSEDRDLLDKPGGVFLPKATHVPREDQIHLQAVASVVLIGRRGLLGAQLDRLERALPPVERPSATLAQRPATDPAPVPFTAQLEFDNELGGFADDGREYLLRLVWNQGNYTLPPQPWVNVIANPTCGFFVSETGGGYTWAANSQAHRLTPWQNDPVSDVPGEVLYLHEPATQDVWSATPAPCGAPSNFIVRHGQGYSVFEHVRNGLHQELTLFVARHEPVKIYRLKIRNQSDETRSLDAVFYAEWVLGRTRDQSILHVVTEMGETGALLARSAFDTDFAGRVAFAEVNLRPRTFTMDRMEFIGRAGSLQRPAGLERRGLSGAFGACLDPCVALQTSVTLAPGAEKEIVFVIGEAATAEEAQAVALRCRDARAIEQFWRDIRSFWDELLGTVTVRTPNRALDLLMNRWLLYQVLSCRMWGRSALYQSGGAYGFRDQLQDSLALTCARPEEIRAQILRAAGRQFREGDVQHWWHPPRGAGVRTRFSDDYLWLPFAVHQYVLSTGDRDLLDERVPFLEAPRLRDDQEEDYRVPDTTDESASIYEHCLRAIENGLRFGAHGLPLMGTGDWNDGMNRVGWHGKGESVWTGWFLLAILRDFAGICAGRGDNESAERFRERMEQLQHDLELNAWDDSWYRRAYFDDGQPLGSVVNDECRIDSLAQSWSVISRGGRDDRARLAMAAVDKQLVKDEAQMVLLFVPPFDRGALEPGYIKGYVPGIRENGGQYTHAALWVVQAFALLGQRDRAVEILNMLNPIQHADTPEKVAKYRLEPYVVAADVYSQPPHVGRGGWSWYTGSAGWFYRVALETILGFELRGDRIRLEPRLPSDWPGYELTYRREGTTFDIRIERANSASATLDGSPCDPLDIPCAADGKTHEVVVRIV